MKKSKFTDSQIIAILKQYENGVPVAELAREHGVSTALIYQWRSKYGGMDAALMKRMKEQTPDSRKCMPKNDSKLRFVRRSLRESTEAISTPGDGPAGS